MTFHGNPAGLNRFVHRRFLWFLAAGTVCFAQNTINRDHFNFGHQSGYMYSWTDSAYGNAAGGWAFTTGLAAYYTPQMPLVTNPRYDSRTMLLMPLRFDFYPCSTIVLQCDLTDLFIQWPLENGQHDAGGKSPRFRTRIVVVGERRIVPAIAVTVGVTFSSAKPYTIWDGRHNYDSSNGLAGAGTGVADYLILITASKRLGPHLTLHARAGLAPLGSPVALDLTDGYASTDAQADEIPYGIAADVAVTPEWHFRGEIAGMYNGLRSTILAHYSVARLNAVFRRGNLQTVIDLERGLTRSTDTWTAGVYQSIALPRRH